MPDFSDKKYKYANLLSRMLTLVPYDLDKREGSVIWNTLAPNAMILSQIYDIMKINQNNQYADTADRPSLIRLCKTRGITPYPAEPTVISANFYSDVTTQRPYNPTSGDTFYVQNTSVLFKVTTQISDGVWKLVCTTPGEVGNVASGRLIPTKDMSYLSGVFVKEILTYGVDEESTESLRKRYAKSFEVKAYSGNRAFYKEYTEKLPGVGGAKIYRAYQGLAGHVGVAITDSNGGVPNQELLDFVQNKLDPVTAHGDGIGVAPIDHIVTVFAASEKTLNIDMTLLCVPGTTWESVSPTITQAIEDFLTDLSKTWADEPVLIIRNAKLQAKLLEIPAILDIPTFTINGSSGSVQLESTEIPKLGTVTGSVA